MEHHITFVNRNPIAVEEIQKRFSQMVGVTTLTFVHLIDGKLVIYAELAAGNNVFFELECVRYFRYDKVPFKHALIRTDKNTLIAKVMSDEIEVLWNVEYDADRIGDTLYLAMLPKQAEIFSTIYKKTFWIANAIYVWYQNDHIYGVISTEEGIYLEGYEVGRGFIKRIWQTEPLKDVQFDILKVGNNKLSLSVRLCVNMENVIAFVYQLSNGEEVGFVDNVIFVHEVRGDLQIRSHNRRDIIF